MNLIPISIAPQILHTTGIIFENTRFANSGNIVCNLRWSQSQFYDLSTYLDVQFFRLHEWLRWAELFLSLVLRTCPKPAHIQDFMSHEAILLVIARSSSQIFSANGGHRIRVFSIPQVDDNFSKMKRNKNCDIQKSDLVPRFDVKDERWYHADDFLSADTSAVSFGDKEIMKSEISLRSTNVFSSKLQLPSQRIRIKRQTARLHYFYRTGIFLIVVELCIQNFFEEISFYYIQKRFSFSLWAGDTKSDRKVLPHGSDELFPLIFRHDILGFVIVFKILVLSYNISVTTLRSLIPFIFILKF